MNRIICIILSIVFIPTYCFIVYRIYQKNPPDTFSNALLISTMINVLCMVTFVYVSEALKLYTFFSEKYYNNLDTKFIDKAYNLLLVKYFKKIVRIVPYKRITNHPSNEQILSEFDRIKKAEINHTLPCLILFVTCIIFLFQQKILLVIMLLFVNFFINIQPIILQRKNRARYNLHILKYRK